MGFPSIKTEEALAATYGMDVQSRNPSHSALGVQPDDVGEELKKWVEVCRRGARFPHVASHELSRWLSLSPPDTSCVGACQEMLVKGI